MSVYLAKSRNTAQLLVFSMLASLLAAGTWLVAATSFGWPVSTTHSIVRAVIGFGLTVVGAHAIHWHELTNIVLNWIITPIIVGVIVYFLFRSVQWFIFDRAKCLCITPNVMCRGISF